MHNHPAHRGRTSARPHQIKHAAGHVSLLCAATFVGVVVGAKPVLLLIMLAVALTLWVGAAAVDRFREASAVFDRIVNEPDGER